MLESMRVVHPEPAGPANPPEPLRELRSRLVEQGLQVTRDERYDMGGGRVVLHGDLAASPVAIEFRGDRGLWTIGVRIGPEAEPLASQLG